MTGNLMGTVLLLAVVTRWRDPLRRPTQLPWRRTATGRRSCLRLLHPPGWIFALCSQLLPHCHFLGPPLPRLFTTPCRDPVVLEDAVENRRHERGLHVLGGIRDKRLRYRHCIGQQFPRLGELARMAGGLRSEGHRTSEIPILIVIR